MNNLKAVTSVLIFFASSLITNSQVLEEMRAVKLTETDSQILFSDENIANAMDYLASIGINAVLPVVLNGGYTQYPSSVMDSLFSKPIDPNFSGRDPLGRVVIEAHRNGIEVYPWFEYGFASFYSGGTPPFGGHILQTYPNWACRTSNGQIATKNGFDWMSGIHPEVQNFIKSLVNEVIENYDLDGVEFSDRIPAMPIEGGYEDYTVELYKSEHNGSSPPVNHLNTAWKRWRADKLNDFYRSVNSLVKNIDSSLFVASSPSVYRWCYDNYLQDPPTWVNEDIVDHFIPQLYRYNLSDYTYELNQAIQQVTPSKRNRIFAGILMNVGDYVISPEFLLGSMQTNRNLNVKGEAFFYYEGLRKNNGLLGDTIKSTFYSEPAIIPFRDGFRRRPPAEITNEDDDNVIVTGQWQTFPINGFKPNILVTNDSLYASVEYFFNVPSEAWFDIYAYLVPNTVNTHSAHYTVFSADDSSDIFVDQANLSIKGWQKIGTENLSSGMQKIVKLDNQQLEEGKYITADAVMIMINRKLSPDVVITGVEKNKYAVNPPASFHLEQNYPNPFNPTTKIRFAISNAVISTKAAGQASEGRDLRDFSSSSTSRNDNTLVVLKIYDILGNEITTLVNEQKQPGSYEVEFDGVKYSSGVYFYKLSIGAEFIVKKMMLLK